MASEYVASPVSLLFPLLFITSNCHIHGWELVSSWQGSSGKNEGTGVGGCPDGKVESTGGRGPAGKPEPTGL